MSMVGDTGQPQTEPHSAGFQLLNQFFKELQFKLMAPKERESRLFKAFNDYLNEFAHGDRNKAIEVVVDAFCLLDQATPPSQLGAIGSGYISPRSFDLIPPQRRS